MIKVSHTQARTQQTRGPLPQRLNNLNNDPHAGISHTVFPSWCFSDKYFRIHSRPDKNCTYSEACRLRDDVPVAHRTSVVISMNLACSGLHALKNSHYVLLDKDSADKLDARSTQGYQQFLQERCSFDQVHFPICKCKSGSRREQAPEGL